MYVCVVFVVRTVIWNIKSHEGRKDLIQYKNGSKVENPRQAKKKKIPGQVHVRFVVDKVALGQVFLRDVGFPLSISFHWCSINCKNLVKDCSSIYHYHWGCTKSLKAAVRGPFITNEKKTPLENI
jgi:hypothetical protein